MPTEDLTIELVTKRIEDAAALLGFPVNNVEVQFTPKDDGKTVLTWDAWNSDDDRQHLNAQVTYSPAESTEDVLTLVSRSFALYLICLTRRDGQHIENAMAIYAQHPHVGLGIGAILDLARVYAADYIAANDGLALSTDRLARKVFNYISYELAPRFFQGIIDAEKKKYDAKKREQA